MLLSSFGAVWFSEMFIGALLVNNESAAAVLLDSVQQGQIPGVGDLATGICGGCLTSRQPQGALWMLHSASRYRVLAHAASTRVFTASC
ncbi:hypothetical protein BC834DRAFT_874009 [Gloeopeniophorella convolvens]|nr:hypothetical protein BC834DRAFT_874009 [Gloeopeniophorella convolvens]